MTDNSTSPDDTAECILQFADREIARLPQAQQEDALRHVRQELDTWLEAITAGKARQHSGPRPAKHRATGSYRL
jgi:hypothetical protein